MCDIIVVWFPYDPLQGCICGILYGQCLGDNCITMKINGYDVFTFNPIVILEQPSCFAVPHKDGGFFVCFPQAHKAILCKSYEVLTEAKDLWSIQTDSPIDVLSMRFKEKNGEETTFYLSLRKELVTYKGMRYEIGALPKIYISRTTRYKFEVCRWLTNEITDFSEFCNKFRWALPKGWNIAEGDALFYGKRKIDLNSLKRMINSRTRIELNVAMNHWITKYDLNDAYGRWKKAKAEGETFEAFFQEITQQ